MRMVACKLCPDCGVFRPAEFFTKDKRRRDGLAFYCRDHARQRVRESKRRRLGPPKSRNVLDRVVPEQHKWCPDCDTVKPLTEFPRSPASRTGRSSYCLLCHNIRGKESKDKVGGSRTYHLKRRYGITAEEADAMLDAQSGLCAICRIAPAAHVDHDHETGAVRALLCFNCNGGLGQFKDDPDVLRLAADYVERHRVLQRSAGSRPEPDERPGTPPGRLPGSRDRRHSQGYARWLAMREHDARRVAPAVPPELLSGS
jgi:Recombination endonuclease VII